MEASVTSAEAAAVWVAVLVAVVGALALLQWQRTPRRVVG
jgi:hypothetical protein